MYEVVKTFIDKDTRQKHVVGNKYDSTVKREKELVGLGYLKEVKEVKKAKVDART